MKFEDLPTNLYTFGFDDIAKDRSPLKKERVEWVLNWVLSNLLRRACFNNKISSYGLKHIAERRLGAYVSNGEMIAAMYLADFRVKREHTRNNGPNAIFNLDTESIRRLR